MQDNQQLRSVVRKIIFEVSTPAGRIFDYLLIVCILSSVIAVMLDSVESLRMRWSSQFDFFEWIFTILFTLEYGVRLWSTKEMLVLAQTVQPSGMIQRQSTAVTVDKNCNLNKRE